MAKTWKQSKQKAAARLGISVAQVDKRADRRREHRKSVGCCQRCGTKGDIDALTIHHIEPLESGGPDAPINWCVLCRGCHNEWHDHEAELRAILARQRFTSWLLRGRRRRDGEMPRL